MVDELRVRQMLDDTRVVEILRERVDDLAAFHTALARAASG